MVEKNTEKNVAPLSKRARANRRNAQLSTGPKTHAGKNHSRQNALKHGVLASALLIKKGGGAEDTAEFEELLTALNRDLAPVGRLEEMMVEKIAVCWWRQKRALRFEALMIRRASGKYSPALCKAMETRHEMFERIRGREKLTKDVEEVEPIFERAGITLPSRTRQIARSEDEITQASHPVSNPEAIPLEEDISDFGSDLGFADLTPQEAIYHFDFPTDGELNRILRYEGGIQRQMVHAINQLERLQRARKGEHVPAPVSVQLSSDQ